MSNTKLYNSPQKLTTGENVDDLGYEKDFLDITRKAQSMKERIDNLLLLPSHFSHVRLCVTPQTAAHQAPRSLGFSRQEHWSGLPFPSPMPESEKWKWSRSVVSDSSRPHGLQPTRLLCPWDTPGKSTGVGCQLISWMSLKLKPLFYRRKCHKHEDKPQTGGKYLSDKGLVSKIHTDNT